MPSRIRFFALRGELGYKTATLRPGAVDPDRGKHGAEIVTPPSIESGNPSNAMKHQKRSQRSETILHAASLFAVLFAVWVLLSGQFTAMLLGSGAVASLLVTFVWLRAGGTEAESHPIHGFRWAVSFWPWLVKEILIANIDVAYRTLHPRLPISPRMIKVPYKTHTQLGTVIFANAITLTPGTVSVAVEKKSILVHALTAESADGVLSGEMHKRVCDLERP
jgi:multicomponent Na+:H+ antiporter subunit E